MSTDVPPPAAPAADTVVNDFYNKEDYVRRRAAFLGKHDGYKNVQVFPIARDDAERPIPASSASSALSGEDTDEDEGEVGVSALRRRSLHVPVKKQVHWDGPPTPPGRRDSESQSESSSATATVTAPQTSRSRKRPATDLDGTDETTATASTTNRQATKTPRLKLRNTRNPQTAPQDDDDDDDDEGEEAEEEEEEEEENDHLEAIIAGTRLPTNRASALRASHTRRARIGDQQPEFFTPEAFPDDGQVSLDLL
ncbi:hypothetical protein KC315_g11031 [Hortaea werneckii]|nr:hypothetical protein KC315_g11031 [Hortaea werneckii]